MPPFETAPDINQSATPRRRGLYVAIGFFAVVLLFLFVTSGPTLHNPKTIISVTSGESVKQIAKELKDAGVIRSQTLFVILIQVADNPIVATGDYIFQKPQNIFTVADRFKYARYEQPTIRIVFNEGMTVREMAERADELLPLFDAELFLQKALPYEGYLFPDTYSFNENATAEQVISTLRANFEKQTRLIQDIITTSPYTLEQIVTMASIVEKEATKDSRQAVADILWNRFEIGMPLQVDASFVYAIGKATADLTLKDLETDGPYNTYKNVGLTPTPISNPGLDAIKAAAQPQPTDNVYFLTGRDGEMYYAKTFEGHKRNRALYLD